jgi:diketogulonate reductase-like aldo/keto reductase
VQVAVKYALSTGKIVIPRTSSEAHLRDLLPQTLQPIHFSAEELLLLRSLDGQLERVRDDGSTIQ